MSTKNDDEMKPTPKDDAEWPEPPVPGVLSVDSVDVCFASIDGKKLDGVAGIDSGSDSTSELFDCSVP